MDEHNNQNWMKICRGFFEFLEILNSTNSYSLLFNNNVLNEALFINRIIGNFVEIEINLNCTFIMFWLFLQQQQHACLSLPAYIPISND